MKNQIEISVIIPVYNVEKYLRACLDSVLAQSFSDYEIICINDASTDGSSEILEHYNAEYKKIKIFHHAKNKGLSVTRNTGMQQAQGKYIFFLDSDDVIAHENVLKQLYFVAENNRLDILYYNFTKLYKGGIEKNGLETAGISRCVQTGMQWFCDSCKNQRLELMACRHFLRRDFLVEHGIDFFDGILHEDMIFSFRCVLKAKRVMEIEECCYVYRQHESSITSSQNRRREQSMYIVLSEVYSYWLLGEFTEEENRAIAYYFDILYDAYKKYQNYEFGYYHLECGKYAEKHVYDLMKRDMQPIFSVQQLKQIFNANDVVIYGAGFVGEKVLLYLRNIGINIMCFAVTDKSKNPNQLYGIKIKEITELKEVKSDVAVIVSVTEKYTKEIVSNLETLGFNNVVTLSYK